MNYCKKCGKQISEQYKYCYKCENSSEMQLKRRLGIVDGDVELSPSDKRIVQIINQNPVLKFVIIGLTIIIATYLFIEMFASIINFLMSE